MAVFIQNRSLNYSPLLLETLRVFPLCGVLRYPIHIWCVPQHDLLEKGFSLPRSALEIVAIPKQLL
jgi:hypothetical protein